MSAIKDINLAPSGAHKIDWVRKNCPLLRSLEDDFSKERPFEGIEKTAFGGRRRAWHRLFGR